MAIPFKKQEILRKKKARLKRNDTRPVCDCSAYSFPHKIGGKCKGTEFIKHYFYYQQEACKECNCLNDQQGEKLCDVLEGIESINQAECYREVCHYCPNEHLPLNFKEYQ